MLLNIILLIIVIISGMILSYYNGFIKKGNKVKERESQIDVLLNQRFDLIPNLVDTVKGYMAHESSVLEKVTELRTSWANAKTVAEKMEISNQLSDTLKTIMAVSENYPDLKANQNFMSLQEELTNTENKISYSRQFYNDTVTRYNTMLETFPSNLVASMFHFEAEKLFEVDNPSARQNVKVDFNK